MKKLIFVAVLAFATVSAHADGALVFDIAAPSVQADGSVLWPISQIFPQVVPVKSCAAASGALSDASKFICVDVSATCHPVLVKGRSIDNLPPKLAERIQAIPPRLVTAGLYTDGKGNCGPLKKAPAPLAPLVKDGW